MQRATSLDLSSYLDGEYDLWQLEKVVSEDEMVGWHHQLNGYEIEQSPEDSKGQGSLACCSSWGYKDLDMIYQLNYNSTNGYKNPTS